MVCNITLFKLKEVIDHVLKLHCSKEDKYLCTFCNTSQLLTVKKVKTHIKKDHFGFKPFQCPACQIMILQKSHLKVHIEKQHPDDQIGLMKKALANHKIAKIDFLSVNVKSTLANGSNDQKKSQKKPQICHLCSNSFYNMKGLNRHIESVHEKKKPYLCDICSHSFTQKGHLNAHIATVHKGAF